MKRTIKLMAAIIGLGVIANSCYYDNPPELVPFDCSDVSYVTHLQPIWDAACATIGCHDGRWEPNLLAEVSYDELLGGGYVNTAVPEESVLYKTVAFISNPMPPGGPKISDRDIEIILCWIEENAPNN